MFEPDLIVVRVCSNPHSEAGAAPQEYNKTFKPLFLNDLLT